MAAAPSANDLTRQQLDELDALLQRMLTLPLSPGEQPPAAPQSYAQAPALRLTTAPPEPAKPFVFEPPPAPPPLPAPEPATPIIERKVVAPSTQIRSMPLPAAPKPAATAPAPDSAPPSEPVPFFLWPLVGVNWLFDSIMGLFGPPGWLVRSGLGKNILGLSGVALILLTVAHVGTQQGWFTLPFPVPWPR
ncbi:MAG: hypothetical protein U0791_16320 [Gemmataceae bacterium]